MKIKLAINYDVPNQEEIIAQVTIPNNKVREIVMNFFNKKNYAQRRKWLKKNLTEILAKYFNDLEKASILTEYIDGNREINNKDKYIYEWRNIILIYFK